MDQFLIVKDPHLAFGFQHKIRKNYEEDIRAKLAYISDYCLQHNVENIVFTGDVFDAQYEKKWYFRQYLKNKHVLEEYFINKNIQIWSVAGNHDFFHGKETIDDTVFGEMINHGIIKHLAQEPLFLDSVEIFGIDYSNSLEKVTQQLMNIDNSPNPHKRLRLAVLHQNITKQSTPYTDYTYEFLANAFKNIHGYIIGHYHVAEFEDGYYRYEKDGQIVLFLSPWNLTRVVRDYHVKLDKFKVSALHFKIDLKTGIDIINVPVPYKKFEDAFIPEMINLLHVSKKEQFDFFENVNLEEITITDDDNQLLSEIAKKNNFDDEVINVALQYLT